MQMIRHNVRQRGLVAAEAVTGIALMALIAALAADAVFDYQHLRDRYYWRQAAAWAAAGQLQRYQAGAPIDSRPPAGIVPDEIALETLVEPGRDQWRGLDRVTVVATATSPYGGRAAHEQISGYVPVEVTP